MIETKRKRKLYYGLSCHCRCLNLLHLVNIRFKSLNPMHPQVMSFTVEGGYLTPAHLDPMDQAGFEQNLKNYAWVLVRFGHVGWAIS